MQTSRIAQGVPPERFFKSNFIFYPQNVPPEQNALNLMTLRTGASAGLLDSVMISASPILNSEAFFNNQDQLLIKNF